MQTRRKPRALTLTLPNAKQPYFVLDGKRYTLRNVSQDGVGLWVKAPAPFGLVPGAQVSGDVVIGSEIFPVGLEIRHVSSHMVGLKFVNCPQNLAKIFKELLEPSLYASALIPHLESGLEDPVNGYPRLWYTGDAGTELVIWYHEISKMIQAMQIRWLGRWVFRKLQEHIETGHIKDDVRPFEGAKIAERDLWTRHQPPDLEIINQAAQFLTSVPRPLAGAVLWQFLESGEQVQLPDTTFTKTKVA